MSTKPLKFRSVIASARKLPFSKKDVRIGDIRSDVLFDDLIPII